MLSLNTRLTLDAVAPTLENIQLILSRPQLGPPHLPQLLPPILSRVRIDRLQLIHKFTDVLEFSPVTRCFEACARLVQFLGENHPRRKTAVSSSSEMKITTWYASSHFWRNPGLLRTIRELPLSGWNSTPTQQRSSPVQLWIGILRGSNHRQTEK